MLQWCHTGSAATPCCHALQAVQTGGATIGYKHAIGPCAAAGCGNPLKAPMHPTRHLRNRATALALLGTAGQLAATSQTLRERIQNLTGRACRQRATAAANLQEFVLER